MDQPHFQTSDAELVRRVRRGDGSAFGQLVDRHGRRLLGLAMSMLGNAADAEDVVQDALTGAFGGLGRFQGRSSVKTWLTRILVNKIARLRRSQRVRRAQPIEHVLDPPGLADATGEADVRMDVRAVLAGLSEDHRAVIVLRAMQGMSYDEIAEALDVPRGTVESRLFRAREILKQSLKDYLP